MRGKGYYRVRWDELTDYPGETTRIYSGPLACERVAFIINRQEPGSGGTMHAHDVAEEVYVLLRGKGTMLVNEERIEMKPLDALRVEPKVMHTSKNDSSEEAWWLVFASPVQEFLDFDAVAYGPPKET